jgi:hypothetical protein
VRLGDLGGGPLVARRASSSVQPIVVTCRTSGLAASDGAWTIVRPGRLTDNPARVAWTSRPAPCPPDDPDYIEPDAEPLDTDVEDADLFLGDDE